MTCKTGIPASLPDGALWIVNSTTITTKQFQELTIGRPARRVLVQDARRLDIKMEPKRLVDPWSRVVQIARAQQVLLLSLAPIHGLFPRGLKGSLEFALFSGHLVVQQMVFRSGIQRIGTD